ncbi:MAG: tyrosine--tRNA ligase [Deltaproteobacteria bacterium CG11_big_fil_rev_8_21_14_0_20_47_16]|nr:MAG: tyrosine--tRNA ligase [Deltaproteobacteria bacterium CG11_big_fil_rev_8_21_14_0_20_47_16]
MMAPEKQLDEIKRGSVELIGEAELKEKLKAGKPLRVKAGFDPTAPDLHLGHMVLIHKLRQFQDLGHQVIFLIGDFTASVGDPSGRSKTRPALTPDEIKANAKTYTDQAFKVLDRNKTEIRFNTEWLAKFTPTDFIKLTSQYTVARLLERDDFGKRLKEQQPLSLHELIYPLLQGYDSVALKADVELGGQDQKFNLVVAREIQRAYGQSAEALLTMPLLEGTDGVQKMSKSYGNYIGITEPPQEMFGKLLSITDDLMWRYYELLSTKTLDEIKSLKAGHPKLAKVALAKEVVARFHSEQAADEAEKNFEQVFAQKGKPDEIEEKQIKSDGSPKELAILMAELGLAKSNSEARRLISQGGVRVDDVVIKDAKHSIVNKGDYLLQVGKRRFLKLSLQ